MLTAAERWRCRYGRVRAGDRWPGCDFHVWDGLGSDARVANRRGHRRDATILLWTSRRMGQEIADEIDAGWVLRVSRELDEKPGL